MNELQVVTSAKQAAVKVRDEDIESEVKEAFETSDFKDIGVEVKNEVVRLTGTTAGNWLLGRKVLISLVALAKADLSGERLNVTLTKKQVEESLSIDTDKPVSRQDEHITTTTAVIYSAVANIRIGVARLDVPEHLSPGHRP